MKKLSLLILGVFVSVNSFADVCSLNNSVNGTDVTNSLTFNNFTCVGAYPVNQVLMDVELIDPYDEVDYCFDDWYSYDIIIDGVPVMTNLCSQTDIDLTSYYPFSSVVITTHDDDDYEDDMILNVTLSLDYSPECSFPSNILVSNIDSQGADLDWDAVGNGISYSIEWGLSGFSPGTGTEVGSASGVTALNYQIDLLNPATDYDVYVMTDCDADGLSNWSNVITIQTLCASLSLPWTENFDGLVSVDYEFFPNCWNYEGDGYTGTESNDHLVNFMEVADALSPENFLFFEYASENYVFTPYFDLVAGQMYEFSFSWAGDGGDGWDGEIVISETQTSSDAIVIGDPFISYGDATSTDYTEERYCFTPDVDGTYSFGFHVMESEWYNYIAIDDVSLKQSSTSVGTDAELTVCEQSGLVNLDDLAQITDFDGEWVFTNNPAALQNGNELNVDVIPNTTVMATYLSNSCLAEDVTATITIVPSISAGEDGVIENLCMNQPIDLLSGLSNDANLGGQFYNGSNQMVDSYINTGNLAGAFNFYYVVGNGGICDDDTSNFVINVNNCDYLTIEELNPSDFEVYPNPTTDVITISGEFGTEQLSLIVTDLNGKIIISNSNVEQKNGLVEFSLSNETNGVYIMKLTSSKGEAYFRVIKQ